MAISTGESRTLLLLGNKRTPTGTLRGLGCVYDSGSGNACTMVKIYKFRPNIMECFCLLNQQEFYSNKWNFNEITNSYQFQPQTDFYWQTDSYFSCLKWGKNPNNIWIKFWYFDHSDTVVPAAAIQTITTSSRYTGRNIAEDYVPSMASFIA